MAWITNSATVPVGRCPSPEARRAGAGISFGRDAACSVPAPMNGRRWSSDRPGPTPPAACPELVTRPWIPPDQATPLRPLPKHLWHGDHEVSFWTSARLEKQNWFRYIARRSRFSHFSGLHHVLTAVCIAGNVCQIWCRPETLAISRYLLRRSNRCPHSKEAHRCCSNTF